MSEPNRAFYWTLVLVISLSVIAIDSLIPAIPLMIDAYQADPGLGQLSIGLYLGGYALGQIPVGLAADRFGRLPVLYTGMILFTLASLVTVLAPNIETLLIARFLQGLAGTVGPVLARAIARDTHSGIRLAHIMAILVTALAAGAMVAPIFGTVLVMLFGWQAPLILNVLVGVLVIIMMMRHLPVTHTPRRDLNLWAQSKSSLKRFLETPQSVWGTLLVGATFFAYFSIATGLGSVLVDYYGFSPGIVGWGFAFAVAFYMASAQTGRLLVRHFEKIQLIRWGAIFYFLSVLIGMLALYLLHERGFLPLLLMGATIVTYLCGMGLIFANASAITLDPIPDIAGFGASLLGTVQMGLGTLGATLTAIFYQHDPRSLLGVMVVGAIMSVGLVLWQKRQPH